MGIKIINSFDLNSPLPLDARAVANNINEMNELITKNFVVAGQMCYNKADNKLYVLKKNSEGALLSWHEIADSVDLDNINKVLPTDIAVKDNKLGLEHDNVWLTNQNAINLGSNLEYDAATKTLNAKGGGGESVSPTLNLIDLEDGTVRTTITEQEKLNLDKGLYNQVYYLRSNKGLDEFSLYMPSRLFSLFVDNYFFSIMIAADENNPVVNNLEFYTLTIGEKNASGEYPITIESGANSGLPNMPFGTGSGDLPISGDSSEIPTLSTIAKPTEMENVIYSDDDIALIKKQENNLIKFPVEIETGNIYYELCYVVKKQNAYRLIEISGTFSSTIAEFVSSTTLFWWDLDETTKKITVSHCLGLSEKYGLYFDKSAENRLIFANGSDSTDFTIVKGDTVFFDTINGKPILHKDSTINNYDLGKSINLFGNHSILVPSSSTDTNIDLYNHFIKITGTKDTIEVRARFTIQSSKNLVVDSLTDLYTLLGNEFEIGCSGLFGENNLTGLRKTTEGVLELIYNNGGAESLQNVAGLTISITDKVKTV